MIISFADKATEQLANRQRVSRKRQEMIKMMQDNSDKLLPVTPGEVLLEEFMLPMNITKYRLAKEVGVPPQRIGDIVAGKRSITADTDLRLCKFFGLSSGYWLRAQAKYDTDITRDKIKEQLDKIVPIAQRPAM
jgi:addiction module HigA family antidote